MKVTLVVEDSTILLTTPDNYSVSGNLISLEETTRERIRQWKEQDKSVDVFIEYSSDYIHRSPIKAGNETWSWWSWRTKREE